LSEARTRDIHLSFGTTVKQKIIINTRKYIRAFDFNELLLKMADDKVTAPAENVNKRPIGKANGVKKNPLNNSSVMYRLNPYAKTQKRQAQIEQERRMKKKEGAAKSK